MKIHILPVPAALQPQRQRKIFPVHNLDYGIEQDFLAFLKTSPSVRLTGPREADWHYLPVFWTRWAVNRGLGRRSRRLLYKLVRRSIRNERKTFTVCQHKDAPFIPLGRTVVFLASRKARRGIDVPLLSSPHRVPRPRPAKKYLASFVGNPASHPIRRRMFRALRRKKGFFLRAGNRGERYFVRKTLESYAALCPRGQGGSSFRFYESLQLGVVPVMIGDRDTRPFKRDINWGKVSFFARTPERAAAILLRADRRKLLAMGKRGARLWKTKLRYGKWCKYALRELRRRRR